MDIVSYRGPGVGGGVSSGIGSAWKTQQNSNAQWWFIRDKSLLLLSLNGNNREELKVAPIAEEIVKGHYAYCNQFLWPLMHGLIDKVSYMIDQRRCYRKFNHLLAQYIDCSRDSCFIQDYQLALLPRLMKLHSTRCGVFWHVPWPTYIPDQFVEPISEIVESLLSAEVVGFHTAEYVANFLSFVRQYLSNHYYVDEKQMLIQRREQRKQIVLAKASRFDSDMLSRINPKEIYSGFKTQLLVKPLGIKMEQWTEFTGTQIDGQFLSLHKLTEKCVLSVDRADYTKAVCERLKAIDLFFERYPDWLSKLTFIQVCGRSRTGIPAFDNYWEKCNSLAYTINDKWCRGDWQPIKWIYESLSPSQLAVLYRQASVMLVNPWRDGLNLTAKEYVAAQKDNEPGVLLLSPGTGAWQELGDSALPAPPWQLETMINSLNQALYMSLDERMKRHLFMRRQLEKNSLESWWYQFSQILENRKELSLLPMAESELTAA